MRIRCPYCGEKALIVGHPRPSGRMEELYCDCTNLKCRARFVYRAYYSHTLSAHLSTLTDSLHEQIAHLSDDERRKLLDTYAPDLPLFVRGK